MKVIIRVAVITDWGKCNTQERVCPLVVADFIDRLGRMAEAETHGF